jgi:lipoprotein signal peptidase
MRWVSAKWFVLSGALIIIDQLTKWLVAANGWSVFINDQFAFSLPVPTPIMFLLYAVILISISYYIWDSWPRFSAIQKFAWMFVYAGGLSNVGERIILGHVRDFIPVATGILNIADFYIFIGLILLLVSQRYSREKSAEDSSDNIS